MPAFTVRSCQHLQPLRWKNTPCQLSTYPIYSQLPSILEAILPSIDGRIILRWIFRKWGGVGGMDWIDLAQDMEGDRNL